MEYMFVPGGWQLSSYIVLMFHFWRLRLLSKAYNGSLLKSRGLSDVSSLFLWLSY